MEQRQLEKPQKEDDKSKGHGLLARPCHHLCVMLGVVWTSSSALSGLVQAFLGSVRLCLEELWALWALISPLSNLQVLCGLSRPAMLGCAVDTFFSPCQGFLGFRVRVCVLSFRFYQGLCAPPVQALSACACPWPRCRPFFNHHLVPCLAAFFRFSRHRLVGLCCFDCECSSDAACPI